MPLEDHGEWQSAKDKGGHRHRGVLVLLCSEFLMEENFYKKGPQSALRKFFSSSLSPKPEMPSSPSTLPHKLSAHRCLPQTFPYNPSTHHRSLSANFNAHNETPRGLLILCLTRCRGYVGRFVLRRQLPGIHADHQLSRCVE